MKQREARWEVSLDRGQLPRSRESHQKKSTWAVLPEDQTAESNRWRQDMCKAINVLGPFQEQGKRCQPKGGKGFVWSRRNWLWQTVWDQIPENRQAVLEKCTTHHRRATPQCVYSHVSCSLFTQSYSTTPYKANHVRTAVNHLWNACDVLYTTVSNLLVISSNSLSSHSTDEETVSRGKPSIMYLESGIGRT
jgi:hypothetical protein